MKLVHIPNTRLLATPYHPIKMGGKWVFPCDVNTPTNTQCDAVFNLLLANGSTMVIEGVECAGLGHGLSGDVIGHAYYANRHAVTNDLKRMPGGMRGWWI